MDQLCKSETDAGVIIVGAPASLQPDDQFSSISMQVRRNCDLFARMLVGRGGIRINATQVAGVKCVFLGDGSSQLQVTNATSRLIHSEAGGFASADFLLGPYALGGRGAPGGTVRRAAVRKRGPAPLVSVSTNFPNDYG